MEATSSLQLQQQTWHFVENRPSSIAPKRDFDGLPFLYPPSSDLGNFGDILFDSPGTSWKAEVESFSHPDPALRYINDILMEEDLDDHKCMVEECSAYQAMAEGFYEILGQDTDDSILTGFNDGFHQNKYRCKDFSSNEEAHQSTYRCEEVSETRDDDEWINEVLNFEPSTDTSSEITTEASLQDNSASCDSNFLRTPPLNLAVHPSRVQLNLSNIFELKSNEVAKDRAAFELSTLEHNNNGIAQRDIATSHSIMSSKADGKHKVYFDIDMKLLKGAWSIIGRPGATTALVPNSSPSEEVDTLSFVRNKELKAECGAKWLIEGPISICRGGPKFTGRKQESATRVSSNAFSALHAGKLIMIDLRSLLVSCAEAIAIDDLRKASQILQDVRQYASPTGSSMERMAHYFGEALTARISGTGPQLFAEMSKNRPSAAQILKGFHVYMSNSPFKKISHFFANYSILKAAEGASRLHIVDYGTSYGFQWPCLISALAERKGGPPHLLITGIEFPQPGPNPAVRLEETGRRLAEYARTYGVPFEFRALACNWEDVLPSSINSSDDEVLVVSSLYRLRHLIDETVTASSPRRTVLANIRSMNPKLFVTAVMNAGLNAPFFITRFKETLFWYSSRFDYLDTVIENDNPERFMIERDMLGREILNIVACEGLERVDRPETYKQWQTRIERAGLEQLPLDRRMVAKAQAAAKAFYHKDFGVDDDAKWLLSGWKGRIMYAFSTWRPFTSKRR